MQSRLVCTLLSLVGTFLTVASCSPAAPGPQAGGGIGGTGSVATVSSGPVTKFGSVFVSGTEYDNTNTLYCIDDEPCDRQNTLKIGMVVRVNGTRTEEYTTNRTLARIADKITYEETVEGVAQSVAADGLSLVVLGQVVSVNQRTEIDLSLQGPVPHTLDPTAVQGALLEISGFVIGDGAVLATLITRHTGPPHYEIEGSIKNHDVSKRTFQIGALVVDYSTPTADISQMPVPTSSEPWNGIVAFARGDQWKQGGAGPNGAELTATRVKPQALGVMDIQDAKVEDFITQVIAPGDFFVNNLHVLTTPSTTFDGGAMADLVLGAHVEVQGSLTNSVLQAEHISFENEVELQSNVAGINASAKTLTLVGFAGAAIQVDGKTAIGGEGSLTGFDGIRIGDHLSIHGRLGAGNIVVATELERTDPSTQVQLQGPVNLAADPALVIAGASVDTTTIPDSGFKDRYGAIGRSAFFNSLTHGKSIILRGTLAGNSVTWQSANLGD